MAGVSMPYRVRRSVRVGDELLLVLTIALAAGLFLLWKQRPSPSVEGVWTDAHGRALPDGRNGKPLVLQTLSANCLDNSHRVAFVLAWPIDTLAANPAPARFFRLTGDLWSDALPRDARDTGIHRDGHHLWISGSQDHARLFVREPGCVVERRWR